MTKDQGTIKKNPREIALDAVMDITGNSQYTHTVLNQILKQNQALEKQDRSFITRICEGTIERLLTIDYIINQYSNIKVNKMKPLIRNLLRISVYQLKYMNQVPDSAVCNEAVKLAKKRGFHNLSGFVNGILRNIIRNPEKVTFPNEEKDPVPSLSLTYSMPEWIIKDWLKYFDVQTVKGILETTLNDKKTTIRCNLDKVSPDALMQMLEREKVNVEPGAYLPYAFHIDNYNYLHDLDTFKKGYFQVQDESSMFVGAVSGIKEDNHVIDVCAAPGGKSLHAADMLHSTGHVSARDVTDYKVSFIVDNIKRLGYTNITAKVQDALILDKDSIEKADVLLADLPCSGLGIIGKKPDIKYNISKEKQKELVLLQRNILEVVYQYVKKGGTLIYSTCTINPEENIENVRWFMNQYHFKLESLNPYLPEILWSDTTKDGYLQLVPGIHHCDGFFIARLRREH